MKEKIRAYFNQLQPLNEQEWGEMERCFTLVEFKKQQILLDEKETCNFIGFINSGIVRFYSENQGNEKITAFWFPGDFISNYRSFIANAPSQHYIQAITEGSYWQLKKEDLLRLYDRYPSIDRLGRKMAEQLYLMVASRVDHLLTATPEQRYTALQSKNSRLLQEIPQYMLAAYLGVSAETLSRIRRRIFSR